MSTIDSVTDNDFADKVLASDQPVLVDFWATWCGPCKRMNPTLEQIATENTGRLSVVKLDIDDNPATARDYQVMSVPTLILFSGGKPVKEINGTKSKKALQSDLDKLL